MLLAEEVNRGTTAVDLSSIEYFRLGPKNLPVHVYRVDPSRHSFVLYNVSDIDSDHNLHLFTMRDLVQKGGFKIALPASMYGRDYFTSTSYMKNYQHVNNDQFAKGYQGILLFNPKIDGIRKFRIAGRRDQNFTTLLSQYDTAISLMRLISKGRSVQWDKAYSNMVTVGVDTMGNMLIVFSSGYRTISSLIEIMLNNSHFTVDDLLYVEGGSKGGLFVSPDTGYGHEGFLPNILGVR